MDILGKSLSAELIIAQSDDELAKVESSIEAVTQLLASRPTDYVAAIYAAASRDVSENALLSNIFTLVKKEWRTVGSRYPGFPGEFLRSVLLCAIVQLAEKKVEFADVLGLVLPNVSPLLKGADEEMDLWQELVDRYQSAYETRAEERWSVPSAMSIAELELSEEASREFSVEQPGVSGGVLAQRLLPAFTSQDSETSEAVESGNPHTFQQLPDWGKHASKRIGAVMAGTLTKGLTVEVSAPDLGALAREISEYISEAAQTIIGAIQGQDLRTRLIWWKESGYSPSARCAYADLSSTELIAHSVIDLSAWLPDRTPPSAFCFVRSALPQDSEDVGFEALETSSRKAQLFDAYAKSTGEWGGRTLLEVIDGDVSTNTADFVFAGAVAKKSDLLIVHLLRELMALRILSTVKAARKPKV